MRTTVLALALAVLASCGGSGSEPVITMDADTGGSIVDTVDGGKDICTPNCGGKECGPNGCGGECGTCKFEMETCTEEGQCILTPCDSTKDCPGALVCDKEQGVCVLCVGDEDCPEDRYCLDTYCVDDICTAGESHCDGLDVVTCNDEGGAEAVTETCTDTQYCENGECLDLVCIPDGQWCDGDIAKKCASDGKSVESESDCAAADEFCLDGACQVCSCMPGARFCLGDFTVVECADNCVDTFETPCGAQQSCVDGECVSWLCEPGSVFCDGEIYKVCSSNGLNIQYEEDCVAKEQHCFNGACIDTECPPNEDFCGDSATMAHCAEDGMSVTTEACPAEHYCDEGDAGVQCLPWVCTPGEAFCEDNIAKLCDAKGSGVLNEVDCGEQSCVQGECIDCQPQCEGKDCGPDACGGSCGECGEGQVCIYGKCPPQGFECNDFNATEWDGCTEGQLTEFGVNGYTDGDQFNPAVAVLSNGNYVIVWRGEGTGDGDGIYMRLFVPGMGPLVDDAPVNEYAAGEQRLPDVAGLSSDDYVVVWDSEGQDGSGRGVFGRVFSSDGTAGGAEFQVNVYTANHQFGPKVEPLAAGQFVVAWASKGQDGDGDSVVAQVFDNEGNKTGAEMQLNESVAGNQVFPALAAANGGEYLAVWEDHGGGDSDIVCRLASADGIFGGSEAELSQLGGTSVSAPCAARLNDGGFLVAWSHSDEVTSSIHLRQLDGGGSPIQPEFSLGMSLGDYQNGAALCPLSDGSVGIAWTEDGAADIGPEVLTGVIAASGDFALPGFVVHEYSIHLQKGADVASLPAGGVVVVWQSGPGFSDAEAADCQDGSGWGVFSRRFDLNGGALYY